MTDLLSDFHYLHTDFQIDNFIITQGNWTSYGRYMQALRQLDQRERGIVELEAERDTAQVDIEELEDKLSHDYSNKFERRRDEIALRQKRAALETTLRSLRDHERERDRFAEIAASLKNEIGELTPGRRAELERETWLVRIKAMVAVDFLSSGRLSASTINLIVSTPPGLRQELLAAIRPDEQKNLIQWFERQGLESQPCLCAADS